MYVFYLKVILRTFYLQLRDTKDFKWTPELQQTFDKVKKLTDGAFRVAFPYFKEALYILCEASNYGIGAALLQNYQLQKMELVSAKSCLLSTTELRLSPVLRECSEKTYAPMEYDFLIQGSQHPIIF